MTTKLPTENYTGCLIGGAIGDALGAPIEFLNISQIKAKFGEQGINNYVEYADKTGEFTDDTQMTLFTAEALLRAHNRAVLKGIGGALNTIAHHSYLRWLYTQNIGVNPANIDIKSYDVEKGWLIKQKPLFKKRSPGTTCIVALQSGVAGTMNSPINNSKGCGTIMRMAPVGLMFYGDYKASFQTACELSAITHGHSTGWYSAGLFASVVSGLAAGETLYNSLTKAITVLKKYDKNKETINAVKNCLKLFEQTNSLATNNIETLGQGWIAEEALAMSLYASLSYERDFKNGLLFSVNHSGDSDSTGSITGNILGLINGITNIPQDWVINLRDSNIVKEVGEDLHTGVKGNTFESDDAWWDKYPGF